MVEPYVEAVSFICKNKDLLNEINKNPKLKKKYPNDELEECIYEKLDNIIFYYEENNEEAEKSSQLYQKEPHRIFNYVFSFLYKLFKEKNINNKLQSAEINDENALELFNKFVEDDKSIITELYYGKKKVAKYCEKCKMTQYSYIYQRAIPLDLADKINDFDLEDELNNLIIEIKNKEFCPICSVERKLKITKTIKEKPKILVIVIYNNKNNIRINYNKSLFNDEYELIGIETTETPKKSVFCLFSKCFKPSQTSYRFLNEDMLDTELDKIQRENPYVLYYRKTEKKGKKKKKLNKKLINLKNINSNEELIDDNNNEKIVKKNNKNDKKIIDNNGNSLNCNNINNINNNINNQENNIVLFFKFNELKELYLDTKDNKTFRVILQEFEQKYNFSISNIKFNGKKIKLNDIPRDLGMKEKAFIIVMDAINIL